ncbi:FliM/FliN family flagellar motor switch protein [Paracoccus ravus]|uniref:FliM/FliN family flagellar motor switch protein n=1 Tax=Paracoccus ravus TaxID=2447760 RepID=UPI00106EA8B4|nr:FliM/FliN family flagellar motor switch protein [Paracoccus ravus]
MDGFVELVAKGQIKIEVNFRMGSKILSVAEISALREGEILTLDRELTDGIEICVGEDMIALGELAMSSESDSRLCVRIIEKKSKL